MVIRARTIERVGPYRAHGLVAAGGSCELVAIEREGARAVVKWLLADCARDARVREAFEHEAALLTLCQSDRLPRLIGRAVYEERPAMVLSWVDGAPLEITAPRSPGECVSIARDALAALHELHELCDERGALGAVHRDVTPSNVLVDAAGRATLVDLGLASSALFARGPDGLSEGTVGYHAPEMFTGAHPVDRRADVFCLGIVLWECLARRPLFARSKFAAANAAVEEDAPDLRELGAVVPASVAAVVARALSRDPARRFETALHFAGALDACMR